MPANLKPIHVWQMKVEQNQVGQPAGQQFQRPPLRLAAEIISKPSFPSIEPSSWTSASLASTTSRTIRAGGLSNGS